MHHAVVRVGGSQLQVTNVVSIYILVTGVAYKDETPPGYR